MPEPSFGIKQDVDLLEQVGRETGADLQLKGTLRQLFGD